MKQVENYKSKCAPHSFEARDSPDSYWRCPQKKSHSFSFSKNSGNLSMEPVTCYYSSSNSYKPQKSHVCSSHSKYASSHSPEMSHHGLQNHMKPSRDKHYSPNLPTMRKQRFDDELGNTEKLKYIHEELENCTEDIGEEEADEEDDPEEAGEFLDKDYEEHEADDEVEEESDTAPQTHRNQKLDRKETLLKQQRWRPVEQDPRRLRCQPRVSLNTGHSSSSRYYHNVAEQDVPEPLSEEDFVPTSLKNPTRRSPTDYHQWSPSRNESDRYDPDLSAPPRRARTKPEMDQLIESEFGKARRCNRCGSMSNKKSELPMKNGCRFDDRASFPIKGPIGDEPDSHDQIYCGRCNLTYSIKDTMPDSSAVLHSTKLRRCRDVKSPTMYEGQMDKLPNGYSRSSSRYHRKADVFPEKMKRSPHGPVRSPRYVDE